MVYYRDYVYLPRLAELQKRSYVYDNDGNVYYGPLAGRRVIIWYHDESILYAHNRRCRSWYHKDSDAQPYQKGEGNSFMIADYFSADFGWLRGINGHTAQRKLCPGKNKDGYYTANEIESQAQEGMDICQEMWPDYDHVFIYDNATTHLKRPEGSLSARAMPKFLSGSRSPNTHDSNFLVEVNRCDAQGKPVYDSTGQIIKDRIPMTGANIDGVPYVTVVVS